MKSYFLRLGSALLGIAAFVALSIILENDVGIPFKTTYRIVCAIACLFFVAKFGWDYRAEQWARITFTVALIFNISLLFSPLAGSPASKGDLLFFAVPDAAIVLGGRTFSYRVNDDHQRAVRQQMILGLVLALVFCAMILAIMFIPQSTAN